MKDSRYLLKAILGIQGISNLRKFLWSNPSRNNCAKPEVRQT
ncbi:hypothetical protein [Pseudalkalibacillus salsuginis]|nr:hypothetical protein [Pseudalkalibacillus salsuginis]